MTKTEIKEILEKYNIRPNRHMGQCFLIDKNIIDKITENISTNDIILEIGAGLGNLTEEIAKKAKRLIAIEKDQNLFKILQERLKRYENIEFVNEDALKYHIKEEYYKIAANIPYYLTSHLIKVFLESKNPPDKMTLVMQREVARRITAKPPKMNLLAVSVQFYSDPKILFHISKTCFWPEPNVDSSLISISNIRKRKDIDSKKFFQIIKAGFSSPRKQLLNNLSSGLLKDKIEIKKILNQSGFDEKIRAERLSVEGWIKIYEAIS